MKPAGRMHHLDARDRINRARPMQTCPTGIPALDELLPGGGWPGTGLIEVLVSHECIDAMSLFMPALAQPGRQERWLALVTPPYPSRRRLLTDSRINPDRLLQVNPHPGRSGLWTVESLLRSGRCGVVAGWPGCTTGLLGRRLQRAAAIGRSLGILIRPDRQSGADSAAAIRLKLEAGACGEAVYLLDGQGDVVAGTLLRGMRDIEAVPAPYPASPLRTAFL